MKTYQEHFYLSSWLTLHTLCCFHTERVTPTHFHISRIIFIFKSKFRVIRVQCCDIMQGVCVCDEMLVWRTLTHSLIHSVSDDDESSDESYFTFLIWLFIRLFLLFYSFLCFSFLISLRSAALSLLMKLRLNSLYLQEPGGRSQVIREIQLTWTDDPDAPYEQAGGDTNWNGTTLLVRCSLFPG